MIPDIIIIGWLVSLTILVVELVIVGEMEMKMHRINKELWDIHLRSGKKDRYAEWKFIYENPELLEEK